MKQKKITTKKLLAISCLAIVLIIIGLFNFGLLNVFKPIFYVLDLATILQLLITILLTIIVLKNDKKSNDMQAIGLIDFYEKQSSKMMKLFKETVYLERDFINIQNTVKTIASNLSETKQIIDPISYTRIDDCFSTKKTPPITPAILISKRLELAKYDIVCDLTLEMSSLLDRFDNILTEVALYSNDAKKIKTKNLRKLFASGVPKGNIYSH